METSCFPGGVIGERHQFSQARLGQRTPRQQQARIGQKQPGAGGVGRRRRFGPAGQEKIPVVLIDNLLRHGGRGELNLRDLVRGCANEGGAGCEQAIGAVHRRYRRQNAGADIAAKNPGDGIGILLGGKHARAQRRGALARVGKIDAFRLAGGKRAEQKKWQEQLAPRRAGFVVG